MTNHLKTIYTTHMWKKRSDISWRTMKKWYVVVIEVMIPVQLFAPPLHRCGHNRYEAITRSSLRSFLSFQPGRHERDLHLLENALGCLRSASQTSPEVWCIHDNQTRVEALGVQWSKQGLWVWQSVAAWLWNSICTVPLGRGDLCGQGKTLCQSPDGSGTASRSSSGVSWCTDSSCLREGSWIWPGEGEGKKRWIRREFVLLKCTLRFAFQKKLTDRGFGIES